MRAPARGEEEWRVEHRGGPQRKGMVLMNLLNTFEEEGGR